jgi:hypothetical protein
LKAEACEIAHGERVLRDAPAHGALSNRNRVKSGERE